jgi:hypothetical protein
MRGEKERAQHSCPNAHIYTHGRKHPCHLCRCERCKGSGESPSDKQHLSEEPCPDCKGTGCR